MPVFVYEVRTAEGQLKRDVIEAENLRLAVQKLQEQKYVVINIRERTPSVASTDVGKLVTPGDPLSGARLLSLSYMVAVAVEVAVGASLHGAGGHVDPHMVKLLEKLFPAIWIVSVVAFFLGVGPKLPHQPDQYVRYVVVEHAYYNSGVIYGIVLSAMGAPVACLYGLGGAAFVLMLIHRPDDNRFANFRSG
ncbi:MAG: hypothetical protein ACYCW6_03710 [Candidatus Xenobia bacterium]